MGDYPDGYLWYGFEKCALALKAAETIRGSFPAGTAVHLYDFGMTAGSDIILAADGKEYELFDVPEDPALPQYDVSIVLRQPLFLSCCGDSGSHFCYF